MGVTSYKICLSLKGMHSLLRVFESTGVNKYFEVFKSLNANPTKQSNTLKQFVCNSQRIVSVFYNFVGLLRWGLKAFFRRLFELTLSWRRPLSYRNQSIGLRSKSVDWVLYDNGLRHERVKKQVSFKYYKRRKVPVCSRKHFAS